MQLVENFLLNWCLRGAGANGKGYNPGRMSYEDKSGVWSPSKRKTNFVVPWPS